MYYVAGPNFWDPSPECPIAGFEFDDIWSVKSYTLPDQVVCWSVRLDEKIQLQVTDSISITENHKDYSKPFSSTLKPIGTIHTLFSRESSFKFALILKWRNIFSSITVL